LHFKKIFKIKVTVFNLLSIGGSNMAQIDKDTAGRRCRQPRASSAMEKIDSIAGREYGGSK
jgi:hypothetical protein